ncbi:MAG TPA: tRNA glutamyl-Q(34) synthetase GluQRS [Terracidiphilus sp.]|jgi:glutamyl/glutaminyl-tRNA synthetase
MATSAGKPGAPSPEYRGRLAPSPTGYLHLGHARTFYTGYLRARQAHGTLVMRMEDLDTARSKPAYAEAAYEDLRWLGIRWQEGPGRSNRNKSDKDKKDGPFGPYLQSQRHAIYLDTWRKLLHSGFLFPCRCSRKDLEAAITAPHEAAAPDDEPIYPGTCRARPTSGTLEAQEGVNWRFRVPVGEAIEFEDLNLGPQRFVVGADFGDFLVWRRDGFPSYQLACVADDAAMHITEVVRGADLLKSTARQILIYRALDLTPPKWYHCHLVVDHNGQRLAKRHDALSIRALRQRGLTPLKVLAANVPMEK